MIHIDAIVSNQESLQIACTYTLITVQKRTFNLQFPFFRKPLVHIFSTFVPKHVRFVENQVYY